MNPIYLGDIDLNEETLAHYGVKGMKWKHRKIQVGENGSKAYKQLAAMDSEEYAGIIKRMKLTKGGKGSSSSKSGKSSEKKESSGKASSSKEKTEKKEEQSSTEKREAVTSAVKQVVSSQKQVTKKTSTNRVDADKEYNKYLENRKDASNTGDQDMERRKKAKSLAMKKIFSRRFYGR